uniref:Protein kinase domain-containing protein n=1 Tax=Salix viminalis TaxID=40686 RepID=A0A6N2L1W8_SALVM
MISPHVLCLETNIRPHTFLHVNPSINLSSTTRPRITDWERGDHIGKGSFASVYKWYSKEHKLFFAAKGVSLNEHRHICHLENEIAVLKRLHHENIIQYYGTEKGEEMLYIFLELVSHGTLEQAYKNCRFKQSQVSHYTRQILLARVEPVLGAWPDRNAVSLDRAIRSGKGPVVPDYLSDTLKDFITQCLQPDPNQRPTAADLLAHRFVNESSCPQPDLTELLLLF